jgi:hypothetical protein
MSSEGRYDGLTGAEQRELIRRKKVNRHLSQVGGVAGVAALGLRAPQFTRAAVSRSPRASRALKRVIAAEPKLTRVSDAVGTTAIGSGAVNSFNWARIQRLETKREQSHVRKAAAAPVKAGRLVATGKRKANPLGAYVRADRGTPMDDGFWRWLEQRKPVGKADDAFLARYRERISPGAEAGYRHLKAGRDRQKRRAAISSASAVGTAGAGVYFHRTRQPVLAGASGALAVVNALDADRNARGAMRWNTRLAKIKARAMQREADGVYGVGRGKAPVVEKRMFRPRKLIRKPSIRRGGLVRLASGRTVTRRGALPGTGDFTR